jgi:hypothetical protein
VLARSTFEEGLPHHSLHVAGNQPLQYRLSIGDIVHVGGVALLFIVLLMGHGQKAFDYGPLVEGALEAVVDEVDLVCIFFIEDARKGASDLAGVLVGRIIRETGEDFGELDTPEPKERDGLAAARYLQRVRILLFSESDGPAEHLRVETTGQASVRGEGADGDMIYFPPCEEREVPRGVSRHVSHHLLHVFGVGACAPDSGLSLAELNRGDRLQGGEDPGLVLYGIDLPLKVPG